MRRPVSPDHAHIRPVCTRVQYATIGILSAAALLAFPSPVLAEDFGLHDFDVTFTKADGTIQTQAGSHPYAMTTSFEANTIEGEGGKAVPVEQIKDVFATQMEGFAGSPTAVPRCSTIDFLTLPNEFDHNVPACADGSAVGEVAIVLKSADEEKGAEGDEAPVYLLEPAPGTAAKLGFWVKGIPITVDVVVSESPPNNVLAASRNISQLVDFFGATFTLWGTPASPAHDEERGACYKGGKSCPAGVSEFPFLTLPRACNGPLFTHWEIDSWLNPGIWVEGDAITHDGAGNPQGMSGCGKLEFGPRISAKPSTDEAASPTGLSFSLDVTDEGLSSPEGLAQSDIKDILVALPEGMTLNPSVAEGLKACSEADLARETAFSESGEGCPEASKVGVLDVTTPILPDKTLHGDLYVATPYENPFDSLIALYAVIKDPDLGVLVTQAIEVTPDPKTGQILSITEDMPQFPLGHVEIRLRVGGRSPMISPPSCGNFETVAELTPWSDPSDVFEETSSFHIDHGVGGGPCPGSPPFEPGFSAGSLNSSAGVFTPFFMQLTRRDGDQDLTRFDATLPPGTLAKLAGVSQCSDAAIAAARQKTGKAEQASPSCPASSLIGHVQGGAGVGSQLTYVPGSLYLAGATNGAPLSVVAIVPAVAGPFDVGNVVVRVALRINPRTGVASVDSSASDPLPHILAGIPLAVRDVQVLTDRPSFTLNPTGCLPSATQARIWGGGANPFSTADDSPLALSFPFQAANCGSLGFKPHLALTLKGGTKRGGHPALRSVLKPRKGDSNLDDLTLRLPHSAFLDQAHIRTICTRVQYAAKACPPGAVYGQATAITPLLDQPLTGPVYLRSSDHNLPDLVFALHGIVDVEAVARIDSKKGGIRASLEDIPDAPITEAIVEMPAGKKGLIVNSTDLCRSGHHARADLNGHNAATRALKPLVKASKCGGKGHKRRSGFDERYG
jgi:hypothetical protein